ncbi:MAG: hypothetical protein JWO83_3018 [Caulobacteraceae bacterium]|nr:hypothetical protein [Caulobacteraceae bacterium]
MFQLSINRAASAIAGAGAGLLALQAGSAQALEFNVANLVSDGSVAAKTIDPSLINPWGISSGPTSPFWVSDNNSGVSTLYDGTGAKVPLTVAIPAPGGGAGTPTGTVFNGAGGFNVSAGGKTGSSVFMFATEDGTIAGWSPTVNFTNAVLAVDNSAGGAGAVYKGLAIGSTGAGTFLYAANFRSGNVEMYNSSFGLVNTFTDPNVATGYAPFNVQNLGGTLYVTYALQNGAKHDDVAGPGNGYVDAFSLDGTFQRRIVSLGGQINSPWGLDIAPKGFASLAGDLLVGNFGDGTISAFDPLTGAFAGKLLGKDGNPIVEGDLWGLITGNGGMGGDPNTVYFTAGVMNEAHGLFGAIWVPEPSSWALMFIGLGLMGATLRGRRGATAQATA